MNGWYSLNKFNRVKVLNDCFFIGLKYIQRERLGIYFFRILMLEVEVIN